jgi:outer membrane lipoprotein-sorting protein
VWTYSDAKVNPALPDSAFDFTAPAGAQKRILK